MKLLPTLKQKYLDFANRMRDFHLLIETTEQAPSTVYLLSMMLHLMSPMCHDQLCALSDIFYKNKLYYYIQQKCENG